MHRKSILAVYFYVILIICFSVVTSEELYGQANQLHKASIFQEGQRFGWKYGEVGVEKFLASAPQDILEILFKESILLPYYRDLETEQWVEVSLEELSTILTHQKQGTVSNIVYFNGVGHGTSMVLLEIPDYCIVGYGFSGQTSWGGLAVYHIPNQQVVYQTDFGTRVTALLLFNENLWIGTNGGVYKLSDNWQRLTLYDLQKGLPQGNTVSKFVTDTDTLWCGMEMRETWDMDAPQSGGIGQYHPKTDTWTFYSDRSGDLPGKWVFDMRLSQDHLAVKTEAGWTTFPASHTHVHSPQSLVEPSSRKFIRSKPQTVSIEEANDMFGINDSWRPPQFTLKAFKDLGEVVIDESTSLMWRKAKLTGSYDSIQTAIEKLNQEQFVGYADWRLPTIAELLSLVEPQKQPNQLYLHPLFGTFQAPHFEKMQWWFWSCDQRIPSESIWLVDFGNGEVRWQYNYFFYSYFAFAVRSL